MALQINLSAAPAKSVGYVRDMILPNSPANLRASFDLASPLCWASGGNPANGNAIKDIVTANSDLSVTLRSGQTITYAGGGFDFSAATNDQLMVIGPSGSLAPIFSDQRFMVMFYARFPASGDWNANGTLAPFFCCTAAEGGYPNEPDLVTICQHNSGPSLQARRQTSGGSTNDTISINPALHYGRVCQVLFWRGNFDQGLRIRSAGGVTRGARAVGVPNSGDFSSARPRWGIMESFWAPASNAEHKAAAKWRLYGGFIEHIGASGRNPEEVADLDYAARIGKYS